MDNEILELLKVLKEGQEEIKENIKRLDSKVDIIHEQIDDMESNIIRLEVVTSKNWVDICHLKQGRNTINTSEDLMEIRNEKVIDVTKQNCYEIANLKAIIRENNTNDSLKFVRYKLNEIERDIFLLKEKITKQGQ